ncbi:MAG: RluA family pseudouridine synthase [Planctomycetes bacterium]|nr:RluA family pseudouridine synthase [Planctomycetota bacterium]
MLFQDDHLVIVDKPRGVLVVSAPGRRQPTLVDILRGQVGGRIDAVHRLDEDTTGVLVLVRDDASRSGMEDLFRRHAIERRYLALITAAPTPPAGCIEARLREDEAGVMRVVARGGETAITHYESRERRGRCTLVECWLETGRRNQIRAHMAALGCPVAGDRKYGYRSRPGESFSRTMLHSWRIAFRHPVTGNDVTASCEAPEPDLHS